MKTFAQIVYEVNPDVKATEANVGTLLIKSIEKAYDTLAAELEALKLENKMRKAEITAREIHSSAMDIDLAALSKRVEKMEKDNQKNL